MVKGTVVVKNASGLHLRPAGFLCTEAMRFCSSVYICFQDTQANAKSILSILGACVKCGDTIEFQCEGSDEKEALAAMLGVAESGFGELAD